MKAKDLIWIGIILGGGYLIWKSGILKGVTTVVQAVADIPKTVAVGTEVTKEVAVGVPVRQIQKHVHIIGTVAMPFGGPKQPPKKPYKAPSIVPTKPLQQISRPLPERVEIGKKAVKEAIPQPMKKFVPKAFGGLI